MLTALHEARADVDVADERLRGDDLVGAAGAVAARVDGLSRVAVLATPTLHTVVAVAGALAGGVCVVPLNPSSGAVERDHVLRDAAPDVVLDPRDVDLEARAPLPAMPAVDGTPA